MLIYKWQNTQQHALWESNPVGGYALRLIQVCNKSKVDAFLKRYPWVTVIKYNIISALIENSLIH